MHALHLCKICKYHNTLEQIFIFFQHEITVVCQKAWILAFNNSFYYYKMIPKSQKVILNQTPISYIQQLIKLRFGIANSIDKNVS